MKTAPHLFEMDDIQYCSACKMSFPQDAQHKIRKAFKEPIDKAHRKQDKTALRSQAAFQNHQQATNYD